MWFLRVTIFAYYDCDISGGSVRRIEYVMVEIFLYLSFHYFQITVEIGRVVRWRLPRGISIVVGSGGPWRRFPGCDMRGRRIHPATFDIRRLHGRGDFLRLYCQKDVTAHKRKS